MAKTAALASQASKLSAPFTVALSQLWLSEEGNVRDRNSVSNDGIKQMSAFVRILICCAMAGEGGTKEIFGLRFRPRKINPSSMV